MFIGPTEGVWAWAESGVYVPATWAERCAMPCADLAYWMPAIREAENGRAAAELGDVGEVDGEPEAEGDELPTGGDGGHAPRWERGPESHLRACIAGRGGEEEEDEEDEELN